MPSRSFRFFTLLVLSFPSFLFAEDPVAVAFMAGVRSVRIHETKAYCVSDAGLQIYEISDPEHPRNLSRLFLGKSSSFAIDLQFPYVYVLSGSVYPEPTFVRIIDVSDARFPRLVTEYGSLVPFRSKDLKIQNGILAVTNANGVDFLNVSDPLKVSKLSRTSITSSEGTITALFWNQNVLFAAYVRFGDSGIVSIDTSDITKPKIVNRVVLKGRDGLGDLPLAINGKDNFLYVSLVAETAIYEQTNHGKLRQIGSLLPTDSLFVQGERLFANTRNEDGVAEVSVFDIRQPEAPNFLAATAWNGHAGGMDFDQTGNLAVVPWTTEEGGGIAVMKALDDGKVEFLQTKIIPSVSDLVSDGNTVYLITQRKVVSVSITSAKVKILDEIELPFDSYPPAVLEGKRLYVSTGEGSASAIHILDVDDPTSMKMLGTISFSQVAGYPPQHHFTVSNKMLFLPVSKGLQIHDVSNPRSPKLLGVYQSKGEGDHVIVNGDIAYFIDYVITIPPNNLAVRKMNLHVLDISSARKPTLIRTLKGFDEAYFCSGMVIDSKGILSLLTIGNGIEGLLPVGGGKIFVADITDVAHPKFIGKESHDTGYREDLAMKDNLLYVADGPDGVRIYSLSRFGKPELVKTLDTPGHVRALTISEGLLHVADSASYQVYRSL